MLDSPDWLPYSVPAPQPQQLFAGPVVHVFPTTSDFFALVAGVAGKAIRINRCNVVWSIGASTLRIQLSSATGPSVQFRIDVRGGRDLIDGPPLDWPVGETVNMSGVPDWTDVGVVVTTGYFLL